MTLDEVLEALKNAPEMVLYLDVKIDGDITASAEAYAGAICQLQSFYSKNVVVVGSLNALVLQLARSDDRSQSHWTTSRLPARVRFAACISLAAWLSAFTLGRLVGYF